VHPILVSGGSEGAIIHIVHWDLSSPIAGTPPIFPTAPSPFAAATSPASYAAPALSALALQIHESGSGLVATAGGRPNGPSMSSAVAVDGQGPCIGQQVDDWAYRWGSADGAGCGCAGSGGGGYDDSGRSAVIVLVTGLLS